MATTNHSLNVWNSDSDLLTNFRSQITANFNTLDAALGLFSSLPTTAKTNLVAAIAEIYAGIKATTDGSSGADYIGATAVAGGFGSTVQSNMEAIYAAMVAIVLGEIPNDSLTEAKMAISLLTTLPTAGGTATALTVAQKGFTLANGAKVEFIAASNNSGAATTVNVNSTGVKSIYKPGGTDAPTLIAGKAYTIWYSTSGGNFFFKASAEGDAVAANVLATKTFSNNSDTGLTGTMPNNAGDTTASAYAVSGTTLKLRAPTGYYDGSDDYVTITDADFVAANIKNGVNLFGLAGTMLNVTVGDVAFAVLDTERARYSADPYTKIKAFTINTDGSYRTSFTLRNVGGTQTVYGRIYKNGVAFGTERSTASSVGVNYSEDLYFSKTDTCELWIKSAATDAARASLFQLKISEVPSLTFDSGV